MDHKQSQAPEKQGSDKKNAHSLAGSAFEANGEVGQMPPPFQLVASGGAQMPIQRQAAPANSPSQDLKRLDEILGYWNVPESEVISLIQGMSATDKETVISSGYKTKIAKALNFGEMKQVVVALGMPLSQQLNWIKASLNFGTTFLGYGEIQSLVTAAPQAERDVLNTAAWRSWFVGVCTNRTMITALNDLNFDLASKLEWLRAETLSVRAELGYSQIQGWVTAAPQAERNSLKTAAWRTFFVRVCTNATMITALNDLNFDLSTKLDWLRAETLSVRAELGYSQIQGWITAAPQTERNSLKTTAWRTFFVRVCTNATMVMALNDLNFDLKTRLDWLIAEGNGYATIKPMIVAASTGQKNGALADQALLLRLKGHLSWNDFAKCVELMGRIPLDGNQMIANANVQSAMAAAWTASNPAINGRNPVSGGPNIPPPANLHEEGGFIYMNLITGAITTDRAPSGSQASLALNNPSPPENAITIGGYHTHPNVGPSWGRPHPSGADTRWATRNGIPLLLRGAYPQVANTSDTFTGGRRLHNAGERGFPGSSGGIAPQARIDGSFDEI